MTTQDAKNLIENQKQLYLFRDKDKWKRVKKYKSATGLILRDFESSSGDTVTISENANGDLNIYDFYLDVKPISVNATNLLSKNNLLAELNKDLAKYGYQPERAFNVHYEVSNWNYISDVAKDDNNFYEDIMRSSFNFNSENKELVYSVTQNGYAYIKVHLGDDNEFPIEAYVYWSERDKRLKGFVPCGKQQYYNYEEDRVYNSEDSESSNLNYDQHNYRLEEQLENIIARDYENI